MDAFVRGGDRDEAAAVAVYPNPLILVDGLFVVEVVKVISSLTTDPRGVRCVQAKSWSTVVVEEVFCCGLVFASLTISSSGKNTFELLSNENLTRFLSRKDEDDEEREDAGECGDCARNVRLCLAPRVLLTRPRLPTNTTLAA